MHERFNRELSKWSPLVELPLGPYKKIPIKKVPVYHLKWLVEEIWIHEWLMVGILWELEDRGFDIPYKNYEYRINC